MNETIAMFRFDLYFCCRDDSNNEMRKLRLSYLVGI
mgnify:CR=1 FL=1